MTEEITVIGGIGGTHARLEDLDRLPTDGNRQALLAEALTPQDDLVPGQGARRVQRRDPEGREQDEGHRARPPLRGLNYLWRSRYERQSCPANRPQWCCVGV